MSTSAASNSGEPPGKKSKKPPSSSSGLPSLPNELFIEILARVPKRNYPVLSCVSKNLADRIRNLSPEIHYRRSVSDLDSLYICFINKSNPSESPKWLTLRRIANNPTPVRVTSIASPCPPDLGYSNVITIGPEIFFVGGITIRSSYLVIFDSRSGTYSDGPNMQVERAYKSVGFFGGKIYVIGGNRDDEMEAESYDLNKQIWEAAVSPEEEEYHRWNSGANVSLGWKVYALCVRDGMTCYDTRDGSCERFTLAEGKWWKTGVCVMDNVLYVYYDKSGLMWFDTKETLWRVVDGLSDLEKVRCIGMAEYYGKLAFLWEEKVSSKKKKIWCRMIGLSRSEAGIRGEAEPPQFLGNVSRDYRLQYCLSVSDYIH